MNITNTQILDALYQNQNAHSLIVVEHIDDKKFWISTYKTVILSMLCVIYAIDYFQRNIYLHISIEYIIGVNIWSVKFAEKPFMISID